MVVSSLVRRGMELASDMPMNSKNPPFICQDGWLVFLSSLS